MPLDKSNRPESIANENITVSHFCRYRTQVAELCVIRESGWITATVWIDSEDIFKIPQSIQNKIVQQHSFGMLSVCTEHGDRISVPCHYIDVE